MQWDVEGEQRKSTQTFLSLEAMPERIYNSHYSNGVPAMFKYLLVLSSWKLNIAENPIAVMGL